MGADSDEERCRKRRKGSLDELRSRIVTRRRPGMVLTKPPMSFLLTPAQDQNGPPGLSRPREPRASPSLAGKLAARVRPPPWSGDFVRIVTELPEASKFSNCARYITSGPVHAKLEKQLRAELGLLPEERLDFRVVARESEESRMQLDKFRRYMRSLPSNDRQVWAVWHGIRRSTTYDTDASRFEPLDPSKVTPNAQRSAWSQNRLGDGLYFSSHLSYNVKGGFYELDAETGAIKLLQCLVLPGNYHHLKFASDPSLTKPPPGHDSRVAYVAPDSPVVIACIHEQAAVFVQYEIHIFGVHETTLQNATVHHAVHHHRRPSPLSPVAPVAPSPSSVGVVTPFLNYSGGGGAPPGIRRRPPSFPCWRVPPPPTSAGVPVVVDDDDDDDDVVFLGATAPVVIAPPPVAIAAPPTCDGYCGSAPPAAQAPIIPYYRTVTL